MLEGKTAIVTGASSGIGAAIVRALRAEGAQVAGGSRRVDRLEADVALELDVTDPESCERFAAAAVEQLGGLDVLVNNAGLSLGRDPFDDSTEEDEEVVLETNVHGLIRMTRLCLPHFSGGDGLDGALPRRRGEGAERLPGRRPRRAGAAGGRRRLRRLRADAPTPGQHRRDR